MSLDTDAFRQVLGCWASGVTIVTARDGERVHGMTVSAFCSVSLEPPLVLICADRTSNTNALIARGGVFSVNILAEGQETISNRFASKAEEARRFEGLRCAEGATGCPLLPGSVASLDCAVRQTLEAGDHVIYIGEVKAARLGESAPLLYYRGRYGALAR
jgi:flavin reductase (DIM6/NTAB) family NADH-FMN oxidoreductase RutF